MRIKSKIARAIFVIAIITFGFTGLSKDCLAKKDPETLSFKDGDVIMWVPAGWSIDESDPRMYLRIMISDERGMIQLDKVETFGKIALEEFVLTWESDVIGPSNLFYEKVSSQKVIAADTYAYQGKYKSRDDEAGDLLSIVTFFIKDDWLYTFLCVSTVEEAPQFEEIFERALKSLEVKG